MRIIAGRYGGRRLEVPKNNDIRPTSDKVRGSIFNALNARLDMDGLHVMDICCGTGAMGLEALSRGAQSCIFVDKSRDSLALTKKNVAAIAPEDKAEFMLADCTQIKTRTQSVHPVDLFFCDPPYKLDLITPCLQSMLDGGWLAEDAYGVIEAEKGWISFLPKALDVLAEKVYGDTQILYVRLC
jgi:16S rRNA (guanine966-N2)-methyltransferase